MKYALVYTFQGTLKVATKNADDPEEAKALAKSMLRQFIGWVEHDGRDLSYMDGKEKHEYAKQCLREAYSKDQLFVPKEQLARWTWLGEPALAAAPSKPKGVTLVQEFVRNTDPAELADRAWKATIALSKGGSL